MKTMSAAQLREYREKEHEKSYLLIDVRQPVEYEESHIPGSILLPLNKFEEQVEQLPEKHLVFYCKSGIRSKAAALTADFFNDTGKDIYTLDGGVMAWNGVTIQGLPSFRIFDLKKSLNEILIDAMNLEKGALRFYEHLLKHCQMGDDLDKVMEQARDGELGHAKIIYSHLKRIAPDTLPFDAVYEKLDGDILEGGTPLDEMIKLLDKRADQLAKQSGLIKGEVESSQKRNKDQIIDILETAISMEYRAFDLYRVMSEPVADMAEHYSDNSLKHAYEEENSLQDAFHALSQAEKAHMNALVKTLEQILSEG
ncbi:MAG: hypothetical protein HQK61_03325 [Desulfamplus sp.]|nr:hypothetical protein [Desulfamplus sp.]